jgi:hypothetical protein
MKTALDLPDDLVVEIKIEAARRGAKLKDLIAELLRIGLDSPRGTEFIPARLTVNPGTGMTVVADTRSPSTTNAMSPNHIADILNRQEAEWSLEAGR